MYKHLKSVVSFVVKSFRIGNSTQVIFCRVVLLFSVQLLSARDNFVSSKNECCSVYSLAHSSQWFRYSAASASLNVARHRGHCNSDRPGHWFHAGLGVAAAAAAAAAGCCCISAVALNRGSEESLCRREEILCPMCTRHMGTTSLFSLLAPCWRQLGTYTVRIAQANTNGNICKLMCLKMHSLGLPDMKKTSNCNHF